MPYRADLEAQKMRCEVLERELADLRLRASALAEAQRLLATKEREVAAAQQLLAGMGVLRALPLLDSLRVSSPCKASWDDMVGDERVKFCAQCAKNVYNLSAMSREEAEALVQAKEGDLCARMYQRADGTILTTDCPVGVRKKRVRRGAIAAVGGGLMAAGLLSASATQGAIRVNQGAVVYTSTVSDSPDPGVVSLDPTPPPPPPLSIATTHAHAVMGGVRSVRSP